MSDNINRIRPALRTAGAVTGNFGRAKVKAAHNTQLGVTSNDQIHRIVTKDEYLNRMYDAMESEDATVRVKEFCFKEIRRILISRNLWEQDDT